MPAGRWEPASALLRWLRASPAICYLSLPRNRRGNLFILTEHVCISVYAPFSLLTHRCNRRFSAFRFLQTYLYHRFLCRYRRCLCRRNDAGWLAYYLLPGWRRGILSCTHTDMFHLCLNGVAIQLFLSQHINISAFSESRERLLTTNSSLISLCTAPARPIHTAVSLQRRKALLEKMGMGGMHLSSISSSWDLPGAKSLTCVCAGGCYGPSASEWEAGYL